MLPEDELAQALANRQQQQLYRQRLINQGPQQRELLIDNEYYLSFCSNDYLGLANHPEVIAALQDGAKRYGVGSGASHLISGHSQVHHALEQALAEFTGLPRALIFSTGYMANLGVLSALAKRHDTIFEDRLNHASLIDAARLSGARVKRYAHSDISALQRQLDRPDNRHQSFIVSDAVFSMDGDCADLAALHNHARHHHAWLLIDDAHGLGTLGPQGRGSLAAQNIAVDDHIILVGTFGKALGTFGAFVAGSHAVIETLIQQARSYIYTTALPPAIAAATLTSLQLLQQETWRQQHLNRLIERFRSGAAQLQLPITASRTAIQPVILGDAENALAISRQLKASRILIPAIRPPTVPQNTSRLRITLSALHSEEDIDYLLGRLAELI